MTEDQRRDEEQDRPREPGGPGGPDESEPTERPARTEPEREPAPGIEHQPEPDSENLIPKKDGPGTL